MRLRLVGAPPSLPALLGLASLRRELRSELATEMGPMRERGSPPAASTAASDAALSQSSRSAAAAAAAFSRSSRVAMAWAAACRRRLVGKLVGKLR